MDNRSFDIRSVPFLIEQQDDLDIWVINQAIGELCLIVRLVSYMSGTSYSVADISGVIGHIDLEEHGWVYYRKPLQTRVPLLVDYLPEAIEAVARYEIAESVLR